MPRKCTICHHADRVAIDQVLVERMPFRHIAAQFGVSTSALVRHSDDHLPAELVKAREAAEVANADTILGHVQTLRDRALTILDAAEATGELRTALAAIREARGCLELLGRLPGELQEQAVVNVLVSGEWRTVQAVILAALEPHPDARQAVSGALNQLEAQLVN